ncbi:MAG TPA: hypothetical protein VEU32_14155 [Burkholderiales bacterium]|nr:hypothetical protein [Burkholderiales bacterium]
MAAVVLLVLPYAIQAQPPGIAKRDGFRATVKALGHDQAASFYAARQLPIPFVEQYAGACVILVAMQNELADAMTLVRLADWRVRTTTGDVQQIRGRGSWLAELDRQGVSVAARIAFEWAQVPEEVDLGAGDSVQGMLSVPVRRRMPFDLILRWQSGINRHEATIEAIRCD